MQPTRNLSPGSENLRSLCWLRSLLVFFEIIALLVAASTLKLNMPEVELALIFLFNTVFVFLTFCRLKYISAPVSSVEFFIQLLIDALAQSVLIYFTGGYTNPLVSVYLVIITTGAALLPGRYSWGLTIFTILAYSLLMRWYQPLQTDEPVLSENNHQQMINLHLMGMWFTFVISALLINYFVVIMAATLRKQQEAIARHREHQIRHENILAIAIQAAGAAHELGTPLATMNVVVEDLQEDYHDHKSLSSDLQLLKTQITECKKRLSHLVEQSFHTKPEIIPVKQLIEEVLSQWQLIRPDIHLDYHEPDWSEPIPLQSDPPLIQALISLLNNAADACSNGVSLTLSKTKSAIIICIDDDGTGLQSASIPWSAYKPFSSQKENGLGIGLLLSQASIERMDGKVRLLDRQKAGTRTEVTFPIRGEACLKT